MSTAATTLSIAKLSLESGLRLAVGRKKELSEARRRATEAEQQVQQLVDDRKRLTTQKRACVSHQQRLEADIPLFEKEVDIPLNPGCIDFRRAIHFQNEREQGYTQFAPCVIPLEEQYSACIGSQRSIVINQAAFKRIIGATVASNQRIYFA